MAVNFVSHGGSSMAARTAIVKSFSSMSTRRAMQIGRGRPGMTYGARNRSERAYQKAYPQEQPKTIYDNWDEQRVNTSYRATYYFLVYCFLNDDGNFSWKEKRTLKKLLKQDQEHLSKEDIAHILEFVHQEPTESMIIKYLEDSKIPFEMANQSAKRLNEYLKYNPRYGIIIKNTIKAYQALTE